MRESADNPSAAGVATFAVAWRLLRRCAGGEGARIVGGVWLILVGAGLALLQPWPLKLVLDAVLGDRPAPFGLSGLSRPTLLVVLCVALLVIHILSALLMVLSTYILVGVGLRMVFRLRCDLFGHIQKLSLRFHDTTTVGDSLYRVTWDSYAVQSLFNSGLIPALTSIVTLVGIAAFLFGRDWTVLLAGVVVGVPLALLVRWIDRPMGMQSQLVRERESQISTRVQETLAGIRAVQAFGREDIESERFRTQAEFSLRASLRLTVFQTGAQAIVGLVVAGGTALVVAVSAMRALNGKLTVGDIVLIASYVAMLLKPLETLAYTAATMQGAAAGARRVFAILDRQPDIIDAPHAVALAGRVGGHIRFEAVAFAYEAARPVLREIDLDIPAGVAVALVGPSGAGKTTLASLILRFYDPVAGRVMLDGRDLRDMTLGSLRANIALVLQEPLLFAATVGENIAYGRPDAAPEQIEAAARAAGAHEFIASLPQGYDSPVGERGVSLSVGQRQRISIARAFLKDAPILILDEPTSALDAQTESDLLDALARLQAGHTTIIIAHRLSTIRHADRIIVMNHGAIAEAGTHDGLLAKGGLYASLYSAQYSASPVHAGVSC